MTSGSGSVANFNVSGDGEQVTVNLSGVSNAQKIVVTVNINDVIGAMDVDVPVSMLVADTTANGSVNSSDISQTKAQSGQSVTASNFRTDVTANGSINSSDISLVKSKSGTALP